MILHFKELRRLSSLEKSYLLMLGKAFLDDSSDGANAIVFVAAGFFCLDPEWKRLRHEWRKVLKPHNITYFRSYECRTLSGEFEKLRDKWGPEKAREIADRIRKRLEQVIESSRIMMGVGFGINMKDFLEVDAMPEARANQKWMRECHDYQTCAFRNAFNLLGHILIVELTGENFVAFVCDDSTHQRKIRRGYERMKEKFPILKERFLGLEAHDDKKVPELQMADLMADLAREMITRYIALGGDQEVPPSSLPENVLRVQIWNQGGMLKVLSGEAVGA